MKLYYYNGQPTEYSITENGKVFSHKSKKWLKPILNKKNGYCYVSISVDKNTKKRVSIHRMVMETFSPNSNRKSLDINHKNGIKTDNRIENLEWVTRLENIHHAIENNLTDSNVKVYAFNDELQLIGSWRSLSDLKKMTGWQVGIISRSCKEKERYKINGYYWSYSEEPDFVKKKAPSSGAAKPVAQYDLNGNLIATFPSCASAAKKLGCNRAHIGEACNGKLKTYYGFCWKYLI